MTARHAPGNDHYDVLVIGSGPGGATTAARVAETGKRVLLLERGDFLPRERDNWNSRAVFGDAKYTADETFYDRRDRPFRPELHYYVGTRRPIPPDTASNDIVATHCVVRVASLDATAAALARCGTPLADHDLMILRGGMRAALVAGPDGHRFLVEERAAAAMCAESSPAQPQEQNS
jgi:hypothetical protein